ncbi:MAG: hypothetical protein P1P73_11970 [Brevefilum sp.]|nr:hypothetical protein [Brevefilum sp.]
MLLSLRQDEHRRGASSTCRAAGAAGEEVTAERPVYEVSCKERKQSRSDISSTITLMHQQ